MKHLSRYKLAYMFIQCKEKKTSEQHSHIFQADTQNLFKKNKKYIHIYA